MVSTSQSFAQISDGGWGRRGGGDRHENSRENGQGARGKKGPGTDAYQLQFQEEEEGNERKGKEAGAFGRFGEGAKAREWVGLGALGLRDGLPPLGRSGGRMGGRADGGGRRVPRSRERARGRRSVWLCAAMILRLDTLRLGIHRADTCLMG